MSHSMSDSESASAAELEREADQVRERVADTIDHLQRNVSLSGFANEAAQAISRHGGDIGRSLAASARANPLPLVLTGVGVAWLIASSRGGDVRAGRSDDLRGLRRGDDTGRRAAYLTPDRYSADGAAGSAESTSSSRPAANRLGGAASDVADAVKTAKDGARTAARRIGDKMSDAGAGVGAAMDGAADRVALAADAATSSLVSGREAVVSGVADARAEAADGAGRLRRKARDAGAAARDRFDDLLDAQPLAVGALAFAAGAMFGGALPRTEREDDVLGDHADEVKNEVRKQLTDEAAKAAAAAKSMAEEVKANHVETTGEADAGAADGATGAANAKAAATGAADRSGAAARDVALAKAPARDHGSGSKTSGAA